MNKKTPPKDFDPLADTIDFSNARRGPVTGGATGKKMISIRLDPDVIDWFKAQITKAGGGSYQAMMNKVLRDHMAGHKPTATMDNKTFFNAVRTAVRKELNDKIVTNPSTLRDMAKR